MKVGDLVKYTSDEARFPDSYGVIVHITDFGGAKGWDVLFHDGTTGICFSEDLEVINESR